MWSLNYIFESITNLFKNTDSQKPLIQLDVYIRDGMTELYYKRMNINDSYTISEILKYTGFFKLKITRYSFHKSKPIKNRSLDITYIQSGMYFFDSDLQKRCNEFTQKLNIIDDEKIDLQLFVN